MSSKSGKSTIIVIGVFVVIFFFLAFFFLTNNSFLTWEDCIQSPGASVHRTSPKMQKGMCVSTTGITTFEHLSRLELHRQIPIEDKSITSNWKVFNNPFLNYSINYPTDWNVGPISSGEPNTYDYLHSPDDKITIEISEAGERAQTTSLKQWFELNKKTVNPKVVNLPTPTKVAGHEAIKTLNTYRGGGILYYVWAGDKIILVSTYGDLVGETRNELDQVLSTLKFTSQMSDDNSGYPQKAANNFYQSYLSCLQNSPSQSTKSCQSLSQDYFAPELIEVLKLKSGFDPILCAQNIPSSISVTNTKISDDGKTATVTVYEKFSTDNTIEVQMKKVGRDWKIDEIKCPSNL